VSVKTWSPLARWLATLSVVTVAWAGAGTVIAIRSSGRLPAADPAALLADLRSSRSYAASGTISERADLGLPSGQDATSTPERPHSPGPATEPNITGTATEVTRPIKLAEGSHTLRAWYDGPTRQRIALVDALSESDLIRNGSDVWLWSSDDKTARHASLPHPATATPAPSLPAVLAGLPGAFGASGDGLATAAGLIGALGGALPKTPQAAASGLLAALGMSATATFGDPVTVAGRRAYSLIISPKLRTSSLISAIRIAVDARQHMALRVQVYAKSYSNPAYEASYTQIAFTRPDRSVFTFNPPPDTRVIPAPPRAPAPQPQVIGSGWTAVVVTRMTKPLDSTSLPAIDGAFGRGRLMETRLVTALLLDDGRVIFGAIEPTALISTAAARPRQP
jgi:hypothetical protein